MNTDSLIEKSLAGDKEAFAQLFNKNRQAVKRLLVVLSNNEFDSNDLLQETFIKAFLNLNKYNKEYPFHVWLSAIARNTFLDYVRRRTARSNMMLLDYETIHEILDENTEQRILKDELKEQVAIQIENLPPRYRKILELRYYVGYDYHEIAAELEIPEGTVKTNLFRAKAELKNQINKIKDELYLRNN